MPLTDTFVKQVKHTGAPAGDKHTDGDGMYLLVNAIGKYWRLNYRFGGKQKTLALGVYPAVSLAAARKRRGDARALLTDGIDPSAAKRSKRAQTARLTSSTFEAVAREWLTKSAAERAEVTQSRVVSWFERDVFPSLGAMPIGDIKPLHVLAMLQTIEARGAIDSARRVRLYCSQVFQMAAVYELVTSDPTAGLLPAMVEKVEGHYAAITDPARAGALLRAIHGYEGHPFATAALKLAPLVFVRPGELRAAEWAEFDLDAAEWRIPGPRMKMGIEHMVPLASQAVELLRAQHWLTGGRRFVFPSIRTNDKCMSENTVNAALRSMGYSKEVMTGHGFRAMARTIMDEVLGERVDLIEHQLAHQVKDVNGRAYNRTAHLPARREMMQRWADYLDKIRRGADVVEFKKG
jgi:integrase